MHSYGLTSVSEFLGDRIVYRNLVPADAHLLPLDAIRSAAGLRTNGIPRKVDPDYARAIVHFLAQARHQDGVSSPLKQLVFIGDTRLLDGTAFRNICLAGGWSGQAFIGSEDSQPANFDIVSEGTNLQLFLANRWMALEDFDRFCSTVGQPVSQETAVVIDLDKTTIGARGRNASVIDQARLQAVLLTVSGLLGGSFNEAAFYQAYDRLNHPEFHPFTVDNQDYLAYICLILGSRLVKLDDIIDQVRSGELVSFHQFIETIEMRRSQLDAALAEVHHGIYTNVQLGDPTPFKQFRRQEYLTTVARMGSLPVDEPVERLLAEEIVITQEVRHWAVEWRQRGALLFGLSDKPDEASMPTDEQRSGGYLPLHHARTHAVGE